MNEEVVSSIMGTLFFIFLLIYSFSSSGITLFLHFILLIIGLFISILMINKITKSSNSIRAKIYFSFIFSFLIFFLILFFWYFGDHQSIDDMGLTTAIVIGPSCFIFMISSFITGIVLSRKRRQRKDFDYSLSAFFWIVNILVVILIVIFNYNPLMSGLAYSSSSIDLCKSLIVSPSAYMFSPRYETNCLWKVAIKLGDENLCENICNVPYVNADSCNINERNTCYNNIAREKGDVDICFKSMKFQDASSCILFLAESTKNVQLCEYLKGGKNQVNGLNEWGRDFCIFRLAPMLGDKSLCDSIIDNETRVECLAGGYGAYRGKY